MFCCDSPDSFVNCVGKTVLDSLKQNYDYSCSESSIHFVLAGQLLLELHMVMRL